MELLDIIKDTLEDIKANDVIIYDMRGISPLYDYYVIATIDSERQSNAFYGYISEKIMNTNYKIRSTEGQDTNWYIIDCSDVVVSLFTKEGREFFNLEKLYLDIPKIK